jgi:transcriptional regulator with XRE-family HTH domain
MTTAAAPFPTFLPVITPLRNGSSRAHRSAEEGREVALHRFVRERRMRLAPDSQSLAGRPRSRNRVGKRVTQEEFAEHLGISRGWYARFEAGAAAGFSLPLLSRLGDMLQLSVPERAELVRLAMPELVPVVPQDSTNLYKALSVVQRTVRRLWAAGSEAELFRIAGEEARRLLPHSELIWVQGGIAQVDIVYPRPEANEEGQPASRRSFRADLLYRFTPEQKARFDAVWQRAGAGDILRFEAYPRDIVKLIDEVLRERRAKSVLAARIRGANGSGGGVLGSESTRAHDVRGLDRAVLSTIAEIASLALE